MNPKHPSRSWTIWFNSFLAFVAAIVGAAIENLPMLKAVLGDKTYLVLMFCLVMGHVALANIALRFKTTEPISFKPPQEPAQ